MDGDLRRLAAAHGVAVEYWDQSGHHHDISRDTVVAVLGRMGVAAGSAEQIAGSLAAREIRDWRRVLPPVFVHRRSREGRVWAHVPHGSAVRLVLVTELGQQVPLQQVEHFAAPRDTDGQLVGEAMFAVPSDLPLGWHRLVAVLGDTDITTTECPLVVVPDRMPRPQSTCGPMVQLYSLRSESSWGVGDLGDLRALVDIAARQWRAGFVLVNPLFAAEPTAPMEPSPYLPATRRFFNPLYLHVEDVPEYLGASPETRERIDALAAALRPRNRSADLLDRDGTWAAKSQALELLWQEGMSSDRAEAFAAFVRAGGVGLQDFAMWCALAEKHGPDWHEWPDDLQDVRSGAVTTAFAVLEDRVLFHSWLQWQIDQQLQRIQEGAEAAGMSVGVIHDLAVGVHGNGADAWRLRPILAEGVAVGAPPDMYNQLGKNWAQPPWNPEALAEAAFVPYRDMLREVLRHAGGLRIDHVLGLYRQWWVPDGMPPTQGTYVTMDHEALIGILMLEASRVGATLIGEDLGTVEGWIREDMHDRGILGTGVLWFQRDGLHVEPPQHWRSDEMLSVTVHDLPPTAGYISGEHIRLRDELGLLTGDVADEWEQHRAELALWRRVMREQGLLAEGAPDAADESGGGGHPAVADESGGGGHLAVADESGGGGHPAVADEIVALYELAALSPAWLLGVQLPDLVGDTLIQNQPGTHREHPNWQVPLTSHDGSAVLLQDLPGGALSRRIWQAVARHR